MLAILVASPHVSSLQGQSAASHSRLNTSHDQVIAGPNRLRADRTGPEVNGEIAVRTGIGRTALTIVTMP
jgi:hypothetical protein